MDSGVGKSLQEHPHRAAHPVPGAAQGLVWLHDLIWPETAFVPSGAFSHSSVVQVPGQPRGKEWGGTGRGWGSSRWTSAWLGNKNLQSPYKASILGYQ